MDNKYKLTPYLTPTLDNRCSKLLYPNNYSKFAYQTFKTMYRTSKPGNTNAKQQNTKHAETLQPTNKL